MIQPKQTTRMYNHSSTRHEQSIRHSQHTQTHTQTTPNKHPTHHYQIHRKLHQRTQSIHHIQKQNIKTTPIQKLCSTRRCSIDHTLQHIHIEHSYTTGTSKTDDLRRRHHHNINIANTNIQSYIHGLRQTISFSTQTKQRALSSHQTQQNTAHNLNYK